MLLLLSSVLPTVWASPCEQRVSISQFSASLDSITIAFADQDVEKLQQLSTTQSWLPCLEEVIPTNVAYQYHLLNGLYYAINEEGLKAQQSFSVAKSLDPNRGIPTYIIPADHPLQESYATVNAAILQPVKSENPEQVWYFDGQSTGRPKDAPTIFQVKEGDILIYTGYIGPYSNLSIPKQVSTPSTQELPNAKKEFNFRPVILVSTMLISKWIASSTAENFRESPSTSTYMTNQIAATGFVVSTTWLLVDSWHGIRSKGGSQ